MSNAALLSAVSSLLGSSHPVYLLLQRLSARPAGGGGGASSSALFRSNANMVESFPGSGTNILDAEVGQIIGVMVDCFATGIRVHWAAAAGTPTLTVSLYDNLGNVLGTANQVVSTTPTTYDVLFGAPVDLSAYRFVDLIVSAWENVAGVGTNNYYSAVTPNFATMATPLPCGQNIESRGSVYSFPGGVMPNTTTGIEIYGVDPILSY